MMRMRIAWFSPVPPDPSGIAAYSAELVPLLAPSFGAIDLYIKTAWPPTDLNADEAKRVDSVGIARAAAADDPAVQFHLVDLAPGVDILGRVGVRAVEILMRSRRDADRRGAAHVDKLRLELSLIHI